MEDLCKRIALPILILGVALGLRWALDPYLGNTNPYITLYGAVAVAVWLGGFLPAAFIALAGLFVANLFFLEPLGIIGFPTGDDVAAAGLYGLSCGLIAALGGALWSARRKADQSAARLMQLDRKRTRFLAILGNELRNALHPIRLAAETMVYAQDPESIRACASSLQRHMHQCGRMVDDLLDLNKATQGKLPIEKYPVDLADIVNSAVNTVRPMYESSAVMIDVVLPEVPVEVEADPQRLSQVFENLLINSAQYTGPGGVVTVAVVRRGKEVLVIVRDTGVGIAKHDLADLFEPFSQSHHSKRGLGIGLALVRTLVELQGGKVKAASGGVGKGSEFTVSLPIIEGQARQELLAA